MQLPKQGDAAPLTSCRGHANKATSFANLSKHQAGRARLLSSCVSFFRADRNRCTRAVHDVSRSQRERDRAAAAATEAAPAAAAAAAAAPANPHPGKRRRVDGVTSWRKDTQAGFFFEEEDEYDDENSGRAAAAVAVAPRELAPEVDNPFYPAHPKCSDCGAEFWNSQLQVQFGVMVCDGCQKQHKDGKCVVRRAQQPPRALSLSLANPCTGSRRDDIHKTNEAISKSCALMALLISVAKLARRSARSHPMTPPRPHRNFVGHHKDIRQIQRLVLHHGHTH